MRHIHFYAPYPDEMTGCRYEPQGAPLEVNESVEYEGRIYLALMTFDRRMCLVVQTDRIGAQVATPAPDERIINEQETKQLTGAGISQPS